MTIPAKPIRSFTAGLTVGLLACLAWPQAQAAEEAITTDRPDFVESSDVVGKGRFQLETSLAFERSSRQAVRTRSQATPTLLRLGVSDNLELRLESDGALRQRTDQAGASSTDSGYGDLSIGAKWHMQEGDEATGKPGIAWLLHLDLDTGTRAFRGQGQRPSLRLVAEWEFAGGYSVGVMPGLLADRDEGGQRYVAGILAAVVGKSFTEHTRGFVEVSGQQLAAARHGGHVVSLDLGVAHLLSNAVQVDTAASWGLNKNTPDLTWAVGLSVRF
jgi:hypothetical protein